jgi:nucleoside-diphosphate-sugar epimerase
MNRIAILGAGGFVGARFVEMAAAAQISNVLPIVRSSRNLARLCRFGLDCRQADVSHLESIRPAIAGCDVVVNLTTGNPPEMAANIRTICKACEIERSRLFIHISSAEVFGRVEDSHLSDDSAPDLRHWMAYARGKGQAEMVLRELMGEAPFPIVVLRPGLIWGPRSSWASGAAEDLMSHQAFLLDQGKGICNLMFVDNLIHSIIGIIRSSPAPGFYNVGDDDEVTWADYYRELAHRLNLRFDKITFLPRAEYSTGLLDHLREFRESKAMSRINALIPVGVRPILENQARRVVGLLRSNDAKTSHGPRITRTLWHLQLTRHRLPTEKFKRTFGAHNLYSFRQAMGKTCQWLRFSGFSLPSGVGGMGL